jgi:hypothetical protein
MGWLPHRWHLACERLLVGGSMADDDKDRIENKILGDIDPAPGTTDHLPGGAAGSDDQNVQSAEGGSQNDPDEIAGNRDVTGVIGGVGTETGGTRNYRQGTGATGGDIGNRPEVYKPK